MFLVGLCVNIENISRFQVCGSLFCVRSQCAQHSKVRAVIEFLCVSYMDLVCLPIRFAKCLYVFFFVRMRQY